jgi:hypothetical protein
LDQFIIGQNNIEDRFLILFLYKNFELSILDKSFYFLEISMRFLLFLLLFFVPISFCSTITKKFRPANASNWHYEFKPEEWECLPPIQITPDMEGTIWQARSNENKYVLMGQDKHKGKVPVYGERKREGVFTVENIHIIAYDRNPRFTVVLHEKNGEYSLLYFSLLDGFKNPITLEKKCLSLDEKINIVTGSRGDYPSLIDSVKSETASREKLELRENFQPIGVSTAPDHSSVVWSVSEEVCIIDKVSSQKNKVISYKKTFQKIPFA